MESVIFWLITTLFGYMALFLSALCIACGLYCAAELAEEHSATAKKFLKYMLLTIAVTHVLFMFAGVSISTLLVSGMCHATYSTLLNNFPYVEPLSLSSIGSLIAVVVSHYIWFQFFYQNYTPVLQITGFFLLMIWSTPLAFFVSLSLGDEALPYGSSDGRVGETNMGPAASRRNKNNIFKGFVDIAMDYYHKFVKQKAPSLGKFS